MANVQLCNVTRSIKAGALKQPDKSRDEVFCVELVNKTLALDVAAPRAASVSGVGRALAQRSLCM